MSPRGCSGSGWPRAIASMANLIIEAVPADQTGVATGMNTNIRNIGAALGAAASPPASSSASSCPNGFPKESGYVLAFAVCGIGLRRRRAGRLPASPPAAARRWCEASPIPA